jgi:PAS domain S-box-containing protein
MLLMNKYQKKPDSFTVLKIIAVYAIFSGLWIYLSDTALGFFLSDPAAITRISVFKGFFFIVITSALLYQLASRYLLESSQLKEEIKNKEQLFNLLSESMMDAFVAVDMSGRIQQCNEVYCTMLGYEKEELFSRTYIDLTPEKWHAMERNIIEEQVIPRGYSEIYEKEYRRKDGTVFPIELRAHLLRDDRGNPQMMWAIVHEITKRKQADEALRQSEERHRTILQTAMDGIWLMDTQGQILEVNETFSRLSGYSSQELLAMRIHALEAAETDEDIDAHIQKIITQGEDRFESRHRRKDGSIFDVEVSAQYQPIEGGRVVAFIRDITERKKAALELQKKNAEIEQFIYTVSHDLRSPLVTIKTFTGYLESDMTGSTDERVAQDLQFIHSAADKMKLLLDELLEMSRIDRIETPPVRVSLMEVVTEALDTLAGVINERKVDIHLPATDLMLLCQIWQNLIENAIKYSRNASIPRIELGVQQMNGETIFFIKDNGIGIESQYYSKIFGIFEKLDHKSPGAGMGLSMIQRIIEKGGGRIWVESEGVGRGACFFFTLPDVVVQD